MFIINIIYVKPIAEIEKLIPAHTIFLDKYYATGNFICSGRKVPRTGGIILCNYESLTRVQEIIQEDPFHQHGAAHYEITEFTPNKYSPAFSKVIEM